MNFRQSSNSFKWSVINPCLLLVLLVSLIGFVSCGAEEEIGIPVDNQIEGYTLVWSDEFNVNTIDESNWVYETGDGRDFGLPAGWGNNELQIYTSEQENASIKKEGDASVLSITALEDGAGGYTSSKMTTNGKFSVRYGRIDIRAKMPVGQGIWPALWLLGDNRGEVDWPGCGEIDIAEVLGNDPSTCHATLHYTNGNYGKGEEQRTLALATGSFADDFHVYSVEWTHESMTFTVDEQEIGTFEIADDMLEFQRSFYLIMNVAVGGYWPGDPDETTSFPQSMLVDYIRVYDIDGYNPPESPPLDVEVETLGGNQPDDLANVAFKEGVPLLSDAKVVAYGSGGEPAVYISDDALDGAQCIAYNFPGGKWGGAWFEFSTEADISSYTNLYFSVKMPEDLYDAEIKLESPTSAAAVFLVNYESEARENGYVEYVIPMSDFEGLEKTAVHIPFSFWNPQDENENFVAGEVLIDNVYFE